MPVSENTAYRLLKNFGLLEFELKRIPEFTGIGPYSTAKVNWTAVDAAVDELGTEFLDRVAKSSRDTILGRERNRPKVQKVRVEDGRNMTYFDPRDLHASDARALVEATRRVRNNLFHGGKEDPLEEIEPPLDEAWALAAAEIAGLLLDLVQAQELQRR